jgi:hypothetical protein
MIQPSVQKRIGVFYDPASTNLQDRAARLTPGRPSVGTHRVAQALLDHPPNCHDGPDEMRHLPRPASPVILRSNPARIGLDSKFPYSPFGRMMTDVHATHHSRYSTMVVDHCDPQLSGSTPSWSMDGLQKHKSCQFSGCTAAQFVAASQHVFRVRRTLRGN